MCARMADKKSFPRRFKTILQVDFSIYIEAENYYSFRYISISGVSLILALLQPHTMYSITYCAYIGNDFIFCEREEGDTFFELIRELARSRKGENEICIPREMILNESLLRGPSFINVKLIPYSFSLSGCFLHALKMEQRSVKSLYLSCFRQISSYIVLSFTNEG